MEEASRACPKGGDHYRTIWFHCASLGEFEQGRPVVERFREAYPGHRLLLTFFSPSGYEIMKNYRHADHVFYLPLDTPRNVRKFMDIWEPDIAYFVKYEFWFNFLASLARKGIPVVVISAIFRPRQHFFRVYGRWFRTQLQQVTHFFVQDEASGALLQQFGIQQVTVGGDTRFDRVHKLSQAPTPFPEVAEFVDGFTVLIAGSTWPKDEEILHLLIHDPQLNLRFIIAPHEVHPERIDRLMTSLGDKAVRFSAMKHGLTSRTRVLVIDSIGILSQLYQYGDIALIGGGFGQGIHNILEAAAYGLPVCFGPNYHKFTEARELLRMGAAFSVEGGDMLHKQIHWLLSDQERFRRISQTSREYVASNQGATVRIIDDSRRFFEK